jgi:hypothetical protein
MFPVCEELKSPSATFADVQLTDVIKNLGTDPSTDPKVKRKLMSVLASWNNQFKSDPSMALVAGLFQQCCVGESTIDMRLLDSMGLVDLSNVKKKQEKEQAKKAKREKELAMKELRKRKMEGAADHRGPPFDFEKVTGNSPSLIRAHSLA